LKTPADFPKLNLPPCRLRVCERGGELCVFDAARALWLVLTPEEWVRRHVLALLVDHMGVPPALISQEYPIRLNGTTQRADIVTVSTAGQPQMLVECKAPEVAISEAVLAQAFRYNSVLGARRVMLTNGLDHYLYELSDDGKYKAVNELNFR
jgi:hypothetical protein